MSRGFRFLSFVALLFALTSSAFAQTASRPSADSRPTRAEQARDALSANAAEYAVGQFFINNYMPSLGIILQGVKTDSERPYRDDHERTLTMERLESLKADSARVHEIVEASNERRVAACALAPWMFTDDVAFADERIAAMRALGAHDIGGGYLALPARRVEIDIAGEAMDLKVTHAALLIVFAGPAAETPKGSEMQTWVEDMFGDPVASEKPTRIPLKTVVRGNIYTATRALATAETQVHTLKPIFPRRYDFRYVPVDEGGTTAKIKHLRSVPKGKL